MEYVSNDTNITDAILISIINANPLIKTIKLSGCSNITDISLIAISKKCKKLEDITINGCDAFTDDGIGELAWGCRLLERVDFRKCENINSYMFAIFNNYCPKLDYFLNNNSVWPREI